LPDFWTDARIGLGQVGDALPTSELLRFQLDHARARDAVHWELGALGIDCVELRSRAADRGTYLRRPDLGRRLSDASRGLLAKGDYDAAIVLADGLSAIAVERHAVAVLDLLRPRLEGWSLAPVSVVRQGRVAVGDEIGERPGLSAPDSLGAYLTYEPRVGRPDAERNCVSNIRPEGLGYSVAAHKLHHLMLEARARRLTGSRWRRTLPWRRWASRLGSRRVRFTLFASRAR
jgi:ethanolamine ammonia-lyase small subunit